MEIFRNSSGRINFIPFQNEPNDPGIKTCSLIEAFFRKFGAFLGIGSGVVELKPDRQKKLYLIKKDTIEWVNRHTDTNQQIPGKKIKNDALLAKIQVLYDSKLEAKGKKTEQSRIPPRQVEIIKGGFPNVGMTSYLSIAMHHTNAIVRSLPPPAPTENTIQQQAGESLEDFEKRKKCVKQISEMFDKINAGKNCTQEDMRTLNTLLSQIDPKVIKPDLMSSTGGDSKDAFDLLCNLLYPNREIFFGGKRWHDENLDNIPPSGVVPDKNAMQVFAERPFGVIGGIPEVVPSDTCEVMFILPNKVESFPYFFTFDIFNANKNYVKDFPETFELSVKDGSVSNAKYELVGMSIKGPDHSYLEKVNGKWIQYESTAIIKELSQSGKKDLVLGDHNKIYMPVYRRVA